MLRKISLTFILVFVAFLGGMVSVQYFGYQPKTLKAAESCSVTDSRGSPNSGAYGWTGECFPIRDGCYAVLHHCPARSTIDANGCEENPRVIRGEGSMACFDNSLRGLQQLDLVCVDRNGQIIPAAPGRRYSAFQSRVISCQYIPDQPIATPVPTPIVTPVPQPTTNPTPLPVPTPTPVATPMPVVTLAPTPVQTVVPTSTPTSSTPIATPIVISNPTAGPTSMPNPSPIAIVLPSPTPVFTSPPESTPTSNIISSPSPELTSTPTVLASPQPTPSPSLTISTPESTPSPVVSPRLVVVAPTTSPTQTPQVLTSQTLSPASNNDFSETGGIQLANNMASNSQNEQDNNSNIKLAFVPEVLGQEDESLGVTDMAETGVFGDLVLNGSLLVGVGSVVGGVFLKDRSASFIDKQQETDNI